MEILIVLALGAAVTAALCVVEGFVLMKLWAWFIIPTFGLPALSIPVAIGICLIGGFLTRQQLEQQGGDALDESVKLFGHGFFNAGLILFVGWIVHTFFMVAA